MNEITHTINKKQIVSYSISTSNHNFYIVEIILHLVVSYSISTSNHNRKAAYNNLLAVVSYSISTSNHNLVLMLIS